MKTQQKVQQLTPHDVAKINEQLSGDDYLKVARYMLKGNAKLSLVAQRLLLKHLRKNPQDFSKRELTLILGVCTDKVMSSLKVVSNGSSNGDDKKVVQEEQGFFESDEGRSILQEVRERQRKVQAEGERQLEERREREGSYGASEKNGAAVIEADPSFVDGIPY